MQQSRLISTIGALCSLALVNSAFGQGRPDLTASVFVDQNGEAIIRVNNLGEVASPSVQVICDTNGYVSLFVDGDLEAEMCLPSIAAGSSLDLQSGVFLNGSNRRILVYADPKNEILEEIEFNNVASGDLSITYREGHDLAVDLVIDDATGVISFDVTNVGNEDFANESSMTAWLTVTERTTPNGSFGTFGSYAFTLPTLLVGQSTTVVPSPALPAATLRNAYKVVMQLGAGQDLDSTNDRTVARYMRMTEVDSDYDAPGKLLQNTGITDHIKWYPPCASGNCPSAVFYSSWAVGDGSTVGTATINRLKYFLLLLEQERDLHLTLPPVTFCVTGQYEPCYEPDDVVDIYLAHVAHSLWFDEHGFDIHGNSQWKLLNLSAADRDLLMFDSSVLYRQITPTDGSLKYGTTSSTPWNPQVIFDFMKNVGIINGIYSEAAQDQMELNDRGKPEGAVWAFTNWFNAYIRHKLPNSPINGGFEGWFPDEKFIFGLRGPEITTPLLGGCFTITKFVRSVFRLLNIPASAPGAFLFAGVGTECGIPHNRFKLPTITKPGATNPGVVVNHTDDLHASWLRSWDYQIGHVPAYRYYFSADQAALELENQAPGVLCPGQCSAINDSNCDAVNPVVDIVCDCDPNHPTDPVASCTPQDCNPLTDPACNTCAQQANVNGIRLMMLAAKDYLPAYWLEQYGTHYVDDTLSLLEVNLIATNGTQVPQWAFPVLDSTERVAFMDALKVKLMSFGAGGSEENQIATGLTWVQKRLFTSPERPLGTLWLDCNNNDTRDSDDIGNGSLDCNGNLIPDECENLPDCNGNGTDDACDVLNATSPDCNANGFPDECEIDPATTTASGSFYCGVSCTAGCPATCIPDCNANGVPDDCDLTAATSSDCNTNNYPDECEIDASSAAPGGPYFCGVSCAAGCPATCESDCDDNGTPDSCDPDCDGNSVPDVCDITAGTHQDCQPDGVPDLCQIIPFVDQSPDLAPIDKNNHPTYTIGNPPIAYGPVTLTFTAHTFHVDPDNFILTFRDNIAVKLNNNFIDFVFVDNAVFQSCPANPDEDSLVVDADLFNSYVNGGNVTISFAPGTFVQACQNSFINVKTEYNDLDGNSNSIPDACEPQVPLAATGYPHEATKNRYISFVPNPLNAGALMGYQVTHVDSGQSWFISTPRTTPVTIDGLGLTYLVSDANPPLYDFGAEPIIHVGGCMIAPDETYEVRATTDGIGFTNAITVITTPQPNNSRFWADVAGAFSTNGDATTIPVTPADSWPPPDDILNGNDNVAVQRGTTGVDAPHITWTDIHPETPDRVTNGNDLLRVTNAFAVGTGVEFYPFNHPDGGPNGAGCTICDPNNPPGVCPDPPLESALAP